MVRALAITHIVVGALLIIFGIADGVTAVLGRNRLFFAGYGFYGVWLGTWVSAKIIREAVNIFLAFAAVLFSRVSNRSRFTVRNEGI